MQMQTLVNSYYFAKENVADCGSHDLSNSIPFVIKHRVILFINHRAKMTEIPS